MLAKHPLDHSNAGLSLKRYVSDKIDQYLSSRRICLSAWHSKDAQRSPLPRACAALHVSTAHTDSSKCTHLGGNSFFEF
jgi:hypothetical protein